KSGSLNLWKDDSWRYPLFDLPLLGVANVQLDAFLQPSLNFTYDVGMGVDTAGVYLDPKSRLGIQGDLQAGLEGRLSVLGYSLAKASGSVGVTVSFQVGLVDPTPGDGKLYLAEVSTAVGNLTRDFLKAVHTDLTVDLQAHVKAKVHLLLVDITVWHHDW